MAVKIPITVDCADVPTVLRFWQATLGYVTEPPPPGHESWEAYAAAEGIPRAQWRGALVDPAGVGPRLFFQTADGGTFTVLRDPEGNEFCVQ